MNKLSSFTKTLWDNKLLLSLFVFVFAVICLQQPLNAEAAVVVDGGLTYGDTTNAGALKIRDITAADTFAAEFSEAAAGAASGISQVVSKASPTRNEFMIGEVKVNGRLDIHTCITDCNAAADIVDQFNKTISTAMTCDTTFGGCTRPFDIAYEQLSGDAMVAFIDTAGDGTLKYCTYNGSAWAPAACGTPSSYTFNGGSVVDAKWVRLIPYQEGFRTNRSDEILMIVSDTNNDIFAAIWDGSAWGNLTTITSTASTSNILNFDGAWETSTKDAMVVWSEGTSASTTPFSYKKWDRGTTTWDSSATTLPATAGTNIGHWVEIVGTPIGDKNHIAIMTSSATTLGNNCGTGANCDGVPYIWDGSTMTKGTEWASLETQLQKHIAVSIEAINTTTQAFFVASLQANADQTGYQTWEEGVGFSGGNADNLAGTSGDMADDADGVITRANPNTNDIQIIGRNIDDGIQQHRWDGSAAKAAGWSAALETAIGPGAVTGNTNGPEGQAYDLVLRPYSPWSRNWRFYNGTDTTNTPTTALAAENTAPTNFDAGSGSARLRFSVQELSALAQTDARKIIQYTTDTPDSTDAVWTDVDDISGSGIWRYRDCNTGSATICDDNLALSAAVLSGTPTAGWWAQDKDAAAGTNMDHAASQLRELEFSVEANGAVGDQTYYFRMYDVSLQSPVLREQDNDGSNDCATAVCTYPSLTTAPIISINSIGTQSANAGINTIDNYVGGAFTFVRSSGTANVTSITITENGTVNGQTNLDNIRLFYDLDTSFPYNCSDASYTGGEAQFGSTDIDGFSGANGTSTFTGSVAVTATQAMCVYVVLDVGAGVAGETIDIRIAQASDVSVSAGSRSLSSTPLDISGSTTLVEYITISGTCDAYDQTTDCGDTGTIKVAVAGVLNNSNVQTTVAGTWSITNFPKPATNDIITVFVDGVASAADKAAAYTKYSGSGNITGIKLFKEHITIGSNQNNSLNASDVAVYDNTEDSDIMAEGSATLYFCNNTLMDGLCIDYGLGSNQEKLYIDAGDTLVADSVISSHDYHIEGTLTNTTNQIIIGGSWLNNGTYTAGTSTNTFNSVSTGRTITAGSSAFYNLTFNGVGGGWTLQDNTTISNVLTIANGNFNGGSGTTITLSGSGTPFVNSGTFTPNTSTVSFTNATSATVAATNYHNLNFSPASGTPTYTVVAGTLNVGGNFSINGAGDATVNLNTSDPVTTITGDLTVAAGDTLVASTTAALNIGGNYSNLGTFTHSNGTVTFNSTSSGKVITTTGSPLYDLIFNGVGGSWTFQDDTTVANALTITNGTLNAGTGTVVTLSGSGTPFVNNGTFDPQTSEVRYQGTTATTVEDGEYYNLTLNPAATVTYTMGDVASATFVINNNFILGNGTNAVTANMTTYDTDILLAGDFTLNNNSVWTNNINSSLTFGIDSSSSSVTDNNASPVNLGIVYIGDGVLNKTVNLNSNAALGTLIIEDNATFNQGANNISLNGSGLYLLQELGSGDFNPGTGTVSFISNSNTQLTSGAIEFYNLSITPTITGDVTYGIGANGGITVLNNFDINPDSSGGLKTLAIDLSGNIAVTGNTTITETANTAALIGFYTYNFSTNDLTTTNTVIINAGSSNITIGGNFSNGSTFNTETGTIIFNNAAQASSISGSNTFNNFTVNTPGKTVNFTAGTTTVINGVLDVNGTSGNNVIFNSTTGSSDWRINHQGTENITYLSVNWGACNVSSTTITMGTGSTKDVNSGTCWAVPVFGIDVSGTVYTDQGVTNIGANKTVSIKVNGLGSYTDETDASGVYSASGVEADLGDVVTIYLEGETENATTVTIADGNNLSNMNLYQDRLIIRHETGASIDNTNLAVYSDVEDPGTGDVLYTYTSSILHNGDILLPSGAKLLVWSGMNFIPGGPVATSTSSNSALAGGDVEIQATATLNMSDYGLTVGGDFVNSGTLTVAQNQITTFTATSTGHSIDGGTGNFYDLTFDGISGGWSFVDANFTITNNLNITNGNLTAPTGNLTIQNDLVNNDVFTHNSGTVIVDPTDNSSNIIGANGINFYNFTITTASSDVLFKSGNTYGFSGNMTITGSSRGLIWLQSDIPGNQWIINFTGIANFLFVNVKDSACIGIDFSPNEKVYNQGNNGACWFFISRGGGGSSNAPVDGGTSGSGGGTSGGGEGAGEGNESSGGGAGGGGGTSGGSSGGGGAESP